MGGSIESGIQLAFAIAHEVGNHLGGIRLQAHLLDDELDAREMAEASILIDGLAGRSGPLLALLRPLLSDDWRRAGGATWAGVLGRIAQQIEDEGTRGVRFEVSGNLDTEFPAPDFDWVHPLLIVLVEATLAHVESRGAAAHVRLDLVELEAGEGVRLDLIDDGEVEDLSPEAARRGRPLAVAIARELVGRSGGVVETDTSEAGTRVGLRFSESDPVV